MISMMGLVSPFPLEGDGGGYFLYHLAERAPRTLECKNRPNAPVIGIREGLSVVAEQVEIAVVEPMHEEPITGRELATGPIPS